MNTTQRPWSLLNFIESYANQGSEQYVSLLNLINKNYAGTSVVIAVGRNTTANYTALSDLVKSGNFEFVNFEQTLNFLKYYERFKEETKLLKTKVALALYALYRIEGFDEDRLIKRYCKRILTMN